MLICQDFEAEKEEMRSATVEAYILSSAVTSSEEGRTNDSSSERMPGKD